MVVFGVLGFFVDLVFIDVEFFFFKFFRLRRGFKVEVVKGFVLVVFIRRRF